MKLSLMLEAKLNHSWLEKQLGKDHPAVQKIVDTDPTGGFYYEWLVQRFKQANTEQFLTPQLRDSIVEWDRNKQVLRNLNIDADLNGKNLAYFNDALEKIREHKAIKASSVRGSGVTHMGKEYPGAKVIYDDGQYVLFKIEGTSPEAIDSLERLGVGTRWCTRRGGRVNKAAEHLSTDTQYVLYKDKKPLYQFDSSQFKDTHNLPEYSIPDKASALIMLDYVGPINDTLKFAAAVYEYDTSMLSEVPEILARYLSGNLPTFIQPSEVIEQYLLQQCENGEDEEAAYHLIDYAEHYRVGRWPAAEPYLMHDPETAYAYADRVIGGRWLEAESIIAKSATAVSYAIAFFGGDRWLEAEPYLLKAGLSPGAFRNEGEVIHAILYAGKVLEGRWPALEHRIAKMDQPLFAMMEYTRLVLNRLPNGPKSLPEFEQAVINDPYKAYNYARRVINARWPEAEPIIMASKYANDYQHWLTAKEALPF